MDQKRQHPCPASGCAARGALTATRAGRFEATHRVAVDDGWDMPEEERLVRTEVRLERPRSALTLQPLARSAV